MNLAAIRNATVKNPIAVDRNTAADLSFFFTIAMVPVTQGVVNTAIAKIADAVITVSKLIISNISAKMIIKASKKRPETVKPVVHFPKADTGKSLTFTFNTPLL